MLLKTLTLKNFRKFKDEVIEFPDGVTGVIGLNGVGKSTIFEAIAWVLYGSVAARTSSDEIKRQAASDSEICMVKLDFIFEEENIKVVRQMKGKNLTTQATMTIDGKVAATGADIVTKFIQKKLGMDFKSFFTSIFAKQKELNTLSSMNASERRPLILRMLGIDSLDEVIKEIRSDKKSKDTLIEKLNDDLTDEKGIDKKTIYQKEVKKKQEKKTQIDKKIKEKKEKLKNFKKKYDELEKKYKQNKKQYEKLNKEKEELSEKKTLFENKKKIQSELKKIETKINERKEKLESEQKKLKDFKNIETDLKSVEMRLEDIERHLEKLVKAIEKNKTVSIRSKEDLSDVKIKRKEIKKIGPNAKCPTCKRVLSDQYNVLLKKFDKELKQIEKELKKYSKEIELREEEKNRIQREQSALRKKRDYLQKKFRKKEGIETTIGHINSEIKNDKSDFENKKKILLDIGKVDFNHKKYESLKRKVQQVYTDYQDSLELLNREKDELSDINLGLEKIQGDKKLIEQEVSNLKERIIELGRFIKKIKQEKNTVKYLGLLSDVMTDFRTFLISRIRPTLSSYASDFYRRLTNGKYAEVELDENYNVLIYDQGESFGIERFSGGEEDLANLCLRLAISEVITERAGGIFNFIVLDEIFGSQDNIRRLNIMKALNSLSSKFRQIFLITHIEDVKNYVENVIQINEKDDGTSSIKI